MKHCVVPWCNNNSSDTKLTRIPSDESVRKAIKNRLRRDDMFNDRFLKGCDARRVCLEHVLCDKDPSHCRRRDGFMLKELADDALWATALKTFYALSEHDGNLPNDHTLFETPPAASITTSFPRCSSDPHLLESIVGKSGMNLAHVQMMRCKSRKNPAHERSSASCG